MLQLMHMQHQKLAEHYHHSPPPKYDTEIDEQRTGTHYTPWKQTQNDSQSHNRITEAFKPLALHTNFDNMNT